MISKNIGAAGLSPKCSGESPTFIYLEACFRANFLVIYYDDSFFSKKL